MKKIVALTMIAALSISTFVGCSKPASTDATKTDSTKPATTTTDSTKPADSVNTNLKDGSYSASYDHFDSKGWKGFLKVDVKDGKIVKADFNYKNSDGKLKTDDANYEKAMKSKDGLGPVEYTPKINDNIVKKGSADIDTVTGATGSTNNAKELLKAVLDKAAKGDTSEAVIATNDTYTAAEKDFDAHGYKAQVSVTFQDGKITKVVFDEVDKNGKKKRDDANYNSQMKAKAGVSAKDASDKLAQTYTDSQKFDTVTGATELSGEFKKLVEQAIAIRQ